ncbi:YfcC family protein [Psychrobacillus soli]|uniref:YfcC family protein n=1 Tax=Psychrobacillus soli TaxID=1543965 RepID=A0A544T8I1_9BACI|nr:Na+/H+ antiporter NhaC family protein [Psychrobacillus soli]TQR13759.1 YfcC family protein [Psychrobacillus soli]
METKTKKEKRFSLKMPDTYVLLFGILLVAAIATYLVPAGQFERIEKDGLTMVVPGTYESVESSGVGVMDILLSLQKGMVESGSIIFLVLFIGGLMEVIESTGSIKAAVMKAIDKTRGNEFILIAVITILFALGGAIGAVANSVIAFVSIGLIISKALRLDPIIAVAITFGATFAGFNVGFINPYSVGIAHKIAELPLFSGLLFRVIVFVVIVSITIWYTWRYAKKVLKDPNNSILSSAFLDDEDQDESELHTEFTNKHKGILIFVGLAFAFMVFGTIQYKWTLDHMSAYFLGVAILVGVIGKIHYNQFIVHFMRGAEKLLYGALIVGAARAILVVLEQGQVLDTIVYALSNLFTGLSPIMATMAMFVANTIISIVVPSGSGQAVLIMPIITPLADMLGVTRQVAVQTYLFGDGFTNSIIPTSGTLMASLAIAGIPYTKWFKWMFPLFLIWMVIAVITLIIGVSINWGPY